jgi:rubrerythrin
MNVTLNAFEAFEIAEKIERNGAQFYRKAASICDDSEIQELFLRLADWEIQHEKIFAKMKKQIIGSNAESMSFRPDETLPDPRVMAGLAIFGIRSEPTEELNGKEERIDILRFAVEKEKDSIVFYNGLKDFLSHASDIEQIDRIIKEEMNHVRILHASLNRITR